jgi:hypothetical protein
MSAVEYAWAAGFIDGEGYLQIARKGGRRHDAECLRPWLRCEQVVRAPLDRLQALLGGSVCSIGQTSVGRQKWAWTLVSGPLLRQHLPLLITHMTVKRRQAEVLLEFVQTMRARGEPGWAHRVDEVTCQRRRVLVAAMQIERGRGQ